MRGVRTLSLVTCAMGGRQRSSAAQAPQGLTLRHPATVSVWEPDASVNDRLPSSAQPAPFSTWSQSPSVYLYCSAAPAGPVTPAVQCVASTRVIATPAGLQSGRPEPSALMVPARNTVRPVASVEAGTVTVTRRAAP